MNKPSDQEFRFFLFIYNFSDQSVPPSHTEDKQETLQVKGKDRIIDLRFGNVMFKTQPLKRTYQEEVTTFSNCNL